MPMQRLPRVVQVAVPLVVAVAAVVAAQVVVAGVAELLPLGPQ